MYEYKERNGKAVKCYRINEDGTKTKIVLSAVRRKKNTIIIMAIEQENNKKPKLKIKNMKIARNEALIFDDLVRAEECEESSQEIKTGSEENSSSTMMNWNK